MATFNLTNQATVKTNVIAAQTLCRNQLLARKDFLLRMSKEQLITYVRDKDPVLMEIYKLYKGLDTYFEKIKEAIDG